jgi:hypothetical protein
MGARAILEWRDSSGLQAGFVKQWGSPAYQLGRIVDWLSMCADQGVTPTVEGYTEHAYTTDVDLIREPFPTHVAIPGGLQHIYTVTTGAYLTVASRDVRTGISHHSAGTDNLADLHLQAARLIEGVARTMAAEQVLTARDGLDPDAADRMFPDPQALGDTAARHRAHALGYAHA